MSISGAVIDTSALIDLEALYPRDVFGGLWKQLELEISQGKLVCPREVARELDERSKDLLKWVKQKKLIVQPDPKLLVEVARIAALYPELKKGSRRKIAKSNSADEWVIALAKTKSFDVISSESSTPNSLAIRKIPDACQLEGVTHMSLVEYFREIGVRI